MVARSLLPGATVKGVRVSLMCLPSLGLAGPWESEKNEWGAPIELTSTVKAASYRRNYEAGVLSAPGIALGSYVFTWGFKMEATAT